jgi:5,10-methylenetetrahydrofolate reductase
MTGALDTCPKRMVHGPCGGVEPDGRCEVDDRHCAFLTLHRPVRADPAVAGFMTPAAAAMATLIATRPVIVADFPGRALDVESTRACADVLAGSVDATLAGDSGGARVQFSPALRAQLIQQRGLPVWSGINCRDRNRVALEGELAALAVVGVAGVHCVTGDHPAVGHRPDALPVFDLDSTRLAALAAAAGHLVSVGEAPASPPFGLRPARLVEKQRAGAAVVFVNHCGPPARVARFLTEVREAGGNPIAIACVPVVVDRGSAELLRTFTSLVLPDGYLDGILAAADPRQAGIEAAVDLADRMLEVPGVRGINLSGGPAPGDELGYAEALAEIATRIGVR